jgi:hypothetical protein
VLGFVGAIFGAIGSFVILGIAGALVLVISGLKRRRANRPPSNTFPGQRPGQQGQHPTDS